MHKSRLMSKTGLIAALAFALVGIGACGESTPWIKVGKARNAYTIELMSHELTAPEAGSGELVGTLRLTDGGAAMELPCLTVDIVFQKGAGDSRFDWQKVQHEVDLAGFPKGGSKEFEVRMPAPDGGQGVTGVTAILHRPLEGGLQSLCEAAAVK